MPDTDRDQDGRDDRSVVRPYYDGFCKLNWFWDTPQPRTESLGGSNCDVPYYLVPGPWVSGVPARYRYQPAVWFQYSPGLFVKSSGSVQWGEPGDDPTVVADYDGDGATDAAVYRPGSPSRWFIHGSKGADFTAVFGEAEDIPAPGDYDGDGRADAAIARIAPNGTLFFYIGQTTLGGRVVNFGDEGDFIIPGDFDGDGRSDIAVTRDVGGILTWYVLGSAGGVSTYRFGETATDYEVPGDYDGDGRADIAVWRASSPGEYFVLQSSNGQVVRTLYGEGATDTPVAGFNIHVAVSPLDPSTTAARGSIPAR